MHQIIVVELFLANVHIRIKRNPHMYPSNNLIYIPMTQSVIVANGLFSKTYKMYNVNIV